MKKIFYVIIILINITLNVSAESKPTDKSLKNNVKVLLPINHENTIFSEIIKDEINGYLYTGDHTGIINVWDIKSKKLIKNIPTFIGTIGNLILDAKSQILYAIPTYQAKDAHVSVINVKNSAFKEIDYFNIDFGSAPKERLAYIDIGGISDDGSKIYLKRRGDINFCALDIKQKYYTHQEMVKSLLGSAYRICNYEGVTNYKPSRSKQKSYCEDVPLNQEYCFAWKRADGTFTHISKADDTNQNTPEILVLTGYQGRQRYIFDSMTTGNIFSEIHPNDNGFTFINNEDNLEIKFNIQRFTYEQYNSKENEKNKHPQYVSSNDSTCFKIFEKEHSYITVDSEIRKYSNVYEVFFFGDAFVVYLISNCTKLIIPISSNGDIVRDVAIAKVNDKYYLGVIVGVSDFKIYDISKKELLLSYINFIDDNIYALTAEGFFSLPQNVAKNLTVENTHKNGKVVYTSLDGFYEVFHRPDIVRAKLRGEDIRPLIGDLTIEKALQNPPPKVSISQTPAETTSKRLKIPYTITPDNGGIAEVRIFHNGKLISSDGTYKDAPGKAYAPVGSNSADAAQYADTQRKGRQANVIEIEPANSAAANRAGSLRNQLIVRGAPEKTCNPCKGEIDVEAIPGEDNTISIVAFNRDNTIQSVPASVSFKSTLPKEEPHLWILSVGINQFKSNNNLNFSALKNANKDAYDFACTYAGKDAAANTPSKSSIPGLNCTEAGKAQSLFKPQNIHLVDTLLDSKATKANIQAALDNIAKQAKPGDTFVWFVASHGMMDANSLFGIIAHDTTCTQTDAKGSCTDLSGQITSNDILEASKKIKAMKQLMVFDTCQSGGLDSKMSGLYDARMSLLAKNMGLHMYASAQATELANDGIPGTNGAFTAQLLAGIKGAAPKNSEGQISIMTLGQYAKQKTIEATQKSNTKDAKDSPAAQTPVIQHFGLDAGLVGVGAR